MEDSWHHLKLLSSGHSISEGFTYDVGNIDASNAGGIFIMRAGQGSGNVNNQTFTIKTMRSNIGNITEEDINENDVFLSLAAIEMVYIPYGGYYLGDDSTANRLGSNNGGMIAVNSEDALSVYPVTAGNVGSGKSLPANFPKGYKGFYCMKYEVSQDQYVSFLNNLTRAQQKARIGNDLDKLKVGEYVFGDKLQPSYRNGICVISNPAGQPAIFGCNLNPAKPFSGEDDGKCIACNYLTPADMLAYCDYACLRPMSELEYEKACRRPYPQQALGGEFVWNLASGVSGLSGAGSLLNAGRINEQPSSAATNVNYNNADLGPVRSASFGTSSSTQTQAGATFWGLMEMSGNVAELCYSINAGSNFNTSNVYTSHGNGEINTNTSSGVSDVSTSIWHTANTSFIAKGGDFTSFQNAELMISDRTRVNVSDVRDSTMGFRAVHTFGGNNVVVNPGIIKVATLSCPDAEIIVSDSVQASATWNGVAMDTRISYVWYVQKGSAAWELIPDAVSASLTYVQESFSGASLVLKFKRKAITTLGEATTAEVSTTVPNLTISFSPVSTTLNICIVAKTVTARVPYTATTPTFSWTTETGTKTGATYTPEFTDFLSGSSGNILVICTAELSGCSSSANLTVSVTPLQPKMSFTCGEDFTDSRDGQVYPTVQIGSQCWMAKNMNIGTLVAGSNMNTSSTAGIQKICYNNSESNCNIYGGLYSSKEMAYGENTNIVKCATDGSGHTQGICPDGWHVPSDAEFTTFANSLGSNPGTKLKSTTRWLSGGNGTNSSGWNGLPGANRWYNGTFDNLGKYGFWWSSTLNSSSTTKPYIRYLYYNNTAFTRHDDLPSEALSVRCLLN
jgi:uncharacterized protein (TIGR02145 family)